MNAEAVSELPADPIITMRQSLTATAAWLRSRDRKSVCLKVFGRGLQGENKNKRPKAGGAISTDKNTRKKIKREHGNDYKNHRRHNRVIREHPIILVSTLVPSQEL